MTPVEPFKAYVPSVTAEAPKLDTSRELEYADDAALLSLARQGSEPAIAALFVRYRQSAEHYARYLGMSAEAPDVVSETFAQIIDLIQRGKGPDKAFRAYLLTSVRHEAGRRAKARLRVVTTSETDDLDTPVELGNGELSSFESGVVRNAYASLPQRWRAVLWELDVEGRSPQEVAERNGMKANAVSALAYRARAGLRESYLQQHVGKRTDPMCAPTRDTMASVVRGTAPKRVRDLVLTHLDTCDSCIADFRDISDLNRELGVIHGPAVAAATAGAMSVGWWSGALSWFSAAKGSMAAALVPAVTVGALAVAPMVAEQDHRTELTGATVARIESEQLPDLANEVLSAATAREVAGLFGPTQVSAGSAAPQHDAPTGLAASLGQIVSGVLDPLEAQLSPILGAVGQAVNDTLGGVGYVVDEVVKGVHATPPKSGTPTSTPPKPSDPPQAKDDKGKVDKGKVEVPVDPSRVMNWPL